MMLTHWIDKDTVFALIDQGAQDRVTLPAAEEALVSDARSPSRKVEFGLGRNAARHALSALHVPTSPGSSPSLTDIVVGRGSLGEPVWPEGYVGSISHTRVGTVARSGAAFGGSVVGRTPPLRLIGLDIESIDRSLPEALPTRICTPNERAWIASPGDTTPLPNSQELTAASPRMLSKAPPNSRALAIFVLKEAVYKALSPLVRAPIGFQEAEVTVGDKSIEVAVTLAAPLPAQNSYLGRELRLHAALYTASGLLIGLVTLPNRA